MASDLVVQFGNILQNPTLFPQEQGRINVTVSNQGNTAFVGPLRINLFASTDDVLDSPNTNGIPLNTLGATRGVNDPLEGLDEQLGSLRRSVNLAPGQSRTFTIDFSGAAFQTPSVVSPGLYNLIAQVQPLNGIVESNTANNIDTQRITNGDVVIQWNSILLNAIQFSGKGSAGGTPPPIAARAQGIVHAAIFDAVNAIDRSYTPYLVNINASDAVGASKEAAAAQAAHDTLVALFTDEQYLQQTVPQQFIPSAEIRNALKATFDAELQRFLDTIPNGDAENKGVAIGQQVAQEILNARLNDGSVFAEPQQGPEVYTPGTDLGDWVPTPDNGFRAALLPYWGRVTPFAIDSVIQFRPDTFPDFASPRYAREFNEVKDLGRDTSTVRTFDQTEIAQFWAYDRDDTFRPPGQLNELAQEVALNQGNTLEENARLFALLNITQADAGIAAWDTKYVFEQIRPITAIREAANVDGNPNTIADPTWTPLLPSPPFPDYISGHSTFAGASVEILELFYGTDNLSYDLRSQDLPGVARSYNSFALAAEEDRVSRIYGGVHIDIATTDGVDVGRNVANTVFNSILQPVLNDSGF
jgi:hypothetical protein